jgi:hypothetical protein
MARLLIKTEGLPQQAMELRLGVNRIGRDPESDFTISHATVSTHHCELVLSSDGVILRDCGSTNGTFVNGAPVTEAWLVSGQEVKLGDVQLLVENTDVNIAIPKFERPTPLAPPPAVLEDGELSCPRHTQVHATFKCTHCAELMCSACVHRLRRQGGATLFLCPVCSHKCEPLQVAKPKRKKTFLGFLQDTVKLKFNHFKGRD